MYSTGAAGLFSAGRVVLRAYLLTTLNGSSSDSGGDLPDGPLGGVSDAGWRAGERAGQQLQL